jgi:hypothetical protein
VTAQPPETRRQGLAFGLTLDCGYEVLGVAGGAPTTRRVRLDVCGEPTPRAEAQRLASAAGLSVDRDDEGYVFTAPELGAHRVSPGGDAVLSAPPAGVEPERWQQLVTGQALPLAAVLQGLEPIHASAVVSDGAALAFTAPSRGGKSVVCEAMVRHGARFLTDDVLALEARGAGGLLAHPGPALATLDGTRTAVQRHEVPAPLGAVYVLEGGPTDRVVVERMPGGDPRALLGATFNALVTDPARLERHLEVCARMTACPLFHVLLPAEAPLERKTTDAVASAVMRI